MNRHMAVFFCTNTTKGEMMNMSDILHANKRIAKALETMATGAGLPEVNAAALPAEDSTDES